ncbi:MAG: SDR family oxidoreductase [Bacteriovoracaceae bacterium]|jgi:3-oxoacyl-[acyl-carrier protein] reductase|nr:SDR family oxidoreductase [Bacteriovoracaceae bacterium]
MNLAGKNILIIGASGAIGKSCAVVLKQAGANVSVTYNRELTSELNEFSDNSFQCDISSYENIENLFKLYKENVDKIDAVINCSGVHSAAPLVGMSEEDTRKLIEVNLTGSIFISQLAVKAMMRKRAGVLIHMGSVSAHRMTRGHVTYSATKAGIEGLVKSLAAEVAKRGIRVNAILPGPVMSPMLEKSIVQTGVNPADMVPMGKLIPAEDIANACAFLVSDLSKMITGVCLPVDGGYLLI